MSEQNADEGGMNSTNDTTNPPFATRTPLHIGAVGITVRDLDQALGFYHNVVGLSVLERAEHAARLGVGDVVLVELTHRSEVQSDDPHTPGLYHVAFVMPTRADLARWALHMSAPTCQSARMITGSASILSQHRKATASIYADRPAEPGAGARGCPDASNRSTSDLPARRDAAADG
jgi:catechol 2,3-dioxygenase